jgi:hypothetical protein
MIGYAAAPVVGLRSQLRLLRYDAVSIKRRIISYAVILLRVLTIWLAAGTVS